MGGTSSDRLGPVSTGVPVEVVVGVVVVVVVGVVPAVVGAGGVALVTGVVG